MRLAVPVAFKRTGSSCGNAPSCQGDWGVPKGRRQRGFAGQKQAPPCPLTSCFPLTLQARPLLCECHRLPSSPGAFLQPQEELREGLARA